MKTGPNNCPRDSSPEQAYTMAEVLVAIAALAIMMVSLFAGYSSGFMIVQMTRENLRATQIMVQEIEDVRLYKWSQVTNSTYLKQDFTNWYVPPSGKPLYVGLITVTNAPTSIPADYRN